MARDTEDEQDWSAPGSGARRAPEVGARASSDDGRRGARLAWILLLFAAIGAAVVLAVRLATWSNCWRWSITEGREGQTIYAIWRVVHGEPVYQWPNQEPYSFAYLNYGFYWFYGAMARLLHASGETLLVLGRIITLLGSIVGTVLFVSTAKLLAPPRARLEGMALVALAFVVWFGTQFIAWWPLSIRPDIWAAVFALAGIRVALPAVTTPRFGRLLASSCLFWLAWSFKQSCILTFVACAMSLLLVTKSWRAALAIATPFAVLVLGSLGVGGEVYRLGIITLPGASAWQFDLMLGVLTRALPQNPWVFGFFPVLLARDWARRRRLAQTLPPQIRALALIAFVTLVAGALSLGREGSNKNHLFEGYIASALAAYWALHQLAWKRAHPRVALAIGALLLLPLVAFPLAQIAAPNRVGRIVFCFESDALEFEKLAGSIARLPKPLYTDDEIFSLPWHSTDGVHPAVVVDPTLSGIAKREGLLARDIPSKLFSPPRFRTVMQVEGHPALTLVRDRGATCDTLPGHPFGFRYVACSLEPWPGRRDPRIGSAELP